MSDAARIRRDRNLMKGIIYCHERGTEWARQYFSDAEPYMLSIGNKPLLEFFVEFCVLNAIKDIYIFQKEISDEIKKYFGDGSKWDINIGYVTLDEEPGLEGILDIGKELIGDDGLLVFNGFFFLQYKKNHLSGDFLSQHDSWQNLCDSGPGLLFLKRASDYKAGKNLEFFDGKHFLQAKSFDGIKAYFDLNMDMVTGAARDYIMHSYNNERGVFIGQNVEIMYGCNVTKPIILGDNIQLKRYSNIGPSAIIGSNSLIDNDTTVSSSIIYRNSYIGSKLEIDNKIIYKRRLIDPESGAMLDIADDFLLAEVHSELIMYLVTWLIEIFFAALLFCFQLPFYLVLRPLVKGRYKKVTVWKDKSGTRKLEFKKFIAGSDRLLNRLFTKFSLHKFHLLPLCVVRKLRLVGCTFRPATEESLRNIRELSNYSPAIFSFSEMCGDTYNDEKCQVDELFYAKHATLRFNLAIFLKSLIFNFLGWTNAKRE